MDYSRRERADRLAAEYVLGTLRGPARRRFESLLGAHPALRAAVADWQGRLRPLADSVPAVEPSPAVWAAIERRLDGAAAPQVGPQAEPTAGTPLPWWQRLLPWRVASGLASAAALALLLAGPLQPQAPPVLVVLAPTPAAAPGAGAGGGAVLPARFVASLSADGAALVLRPIDAPRLDARQALELWAVPPAGAPRSLGLVRADGTTTLAHLRLPQGTAALAVSIEPAGGSPTGAPTGPVVSAGALRS